MECVYRLLLSALAVQWKSYLLATGSYLFPLFLTSDQECFCMTIFYSLTHFGARIYYTEGTCIRYWYVKSSLQPEITEGFKRKKMLVFCLCIPQLLLLFQFIDALWAYTTKEQFPLLLYKACIDPTSGYSIQLFKSMPFQVIATYAYVFTMAYNNIYLYRFLRYD